jgi:hypothetical protein
LDPPSPLLLLINFVSAGATGDAIWLASSPKRYFSHE